MISRIVLLAKPGHIFIVLVILLFPIIQFPPSAHDLLSFPFFFPLPILIPFYLWLALLGKWLNRLLPSQTKNSERLFRVSGWYAALYYIFGYIGGAILIIIDPTFLMRSWAWVLITPFHSFGLFAVTYMVFFVARAIASQEVKRAPNTHEILGAFVPFVFLPIGVWFIQPRIRKIILGSDFFAPPEVAA